MLPFLNISVELMIDEIKHNSMVIQGSVKVWGLRNCGVDIYTPAFISPNGQLKQKQLGEYSSIRWTRL